RSRPPTPRNLPPTPAIQNHIVVEPRPDVLRADADVAARAGYPRRPCRGSATQLPPRWACIKTAYDGNFLQLSPGRHEGNGMDATPITAPEAPIAAKSVSRWPLRMMVVLALAGVLFCARLSERALWSEEGRWAKIPREMQQSGNYFWPTINGRTYYDKPLGSYWLVLLASLVTDGVDETSARLPSALSGLIAVALAMLIARRLYDDDTALLSGAILATSFSFVFFARNASADVETVAGILAALW